MRLLNLPALALVLIALAFAPVTRAQPAARSAADFPTRPITLVVTSVPGGGIDVLMRAIATELGKRFGHNVVVDNKAGAGGSIASAFVARAAPDGYTLLAGTEQHLITQALLNPKLGFDPRKDFVPISLVAQADQLVVAQANFPGNTMADVVALARKEPGRVTYGSWGEGSHPHLLFSTLSKIANVDLLHIPYKGVAHVMQALGAAEVQLSVMSGGTAGPLIRAGKVKVLAAASRERSPSFPQVPTTAESGYPQLRSAIWFLLAAPAATPPAVVKKLSSEIQAVVRQPEFAQANVISKGWQLVASDSAGLKEAADELYPVMKDMVDKAGIKAP